MIMAVVDATIDIKTPTMVFDVPDGFDWSESTMQLLVNGYLAGFAINRTTNQVESLVTLLPSHDVILRKFEVG